MTARRTSHRLALLVGALMAALPSVAGTPKGAMSVIFLQNGAHRTASENFHVVREKDGYITWRNYGESDQTDWDSGTRVYEIKEGDTLRKIAARVYGHEQMWTALLQANSDVLEKPEDIRVGQVLVLP